jgi:hypothetical protein
MYIYIYYNIYLFHMYGGWWKGFLADHHRIYCCSCIVVAVCIWLYWCIFILLHHPGLESCGVNGHTSAGVEPRVASMRTVWIPGRHKLLKSAKAAMKLTTQSPKCALRWPNKRSWKSSTNECSAGVVRGPQNSIAEKLGIQPGWVPYPFHQHDAVSVPQPFGSLSMSIMLARFRFMGKLHDCSWLCFVRWTMVTTARYTQHIWLAD